MPDTQFTQVQYTLQGLMNQIQMGQIGLPDIQRPFVWKNIKVRDLFDSMYRGYPVGYLLFWQNGLPGGHKQIGADIKQLVPQLLVVDGQQRLTSLHAVLNSQPVVREDYKTEPIAIAFSPLEERFEVYDAAIARDKSFIPSISELWAGDTGLFDLTDRYLTELRSTRDVTSDEERRIKAAISRLNSLTSFPFTALVLSADIDEEQVAEVFVRINSKGITLNQADFILTLMSVFWDDGRKDLEAFCRDAREPSEGRPSPFNWYMKPLPDQLLRASVGLGFKRARLQYVYSILRGKDLETEKFSDDRRVRQFEVLKAAQSKALDLQHWHDFWNVIRQAGYPNGKTITSENNVLYTYVMYLIGRCEYKMEEPRLRRLIARWFFMVTLTGRYTGSPESSMEFDLAMLREVKDADGFASALSRVCDETLTNDFWTINLPSDLATSAARSPTMFAYYAALVLLDAQALFSEQKVSTLLGAGQQAPRSIERHHLFPKNYLKKLDITSSRDTNQTANYALADWSDNAWIADMAPADYLPELIKRFAKPQMVPQMYHWHALPDGWETMEYKAFLERRRELMAAVIREAYETLRGIEEAEPSEAVVLVSAMVHQGESRTIEFKGALRMNLHTMQTDPRIEFTALRTIAGFLNSDGGTLVLGVMDNGDPVGYEADGFKSKDVMLLHLDNLVRTRLGAQFAMYIHPRFAEYEDCEVLTVECSASKSPVYMKDGNIERFFIRAGASTSELTMSEAQDYVKQRFA
jgi:hypothetical protein